VEFLGTNRGKTMSFLRDCGISFIVLLILCNSGRAVKEEANGDSVQDEVEGTSELDPRNSVRNC